VSTLDFTKSAKPLVSLSEWFRCGFRTSLGFTLKFNIFQRLSPPAGAQSEFGGPEWQLCLYRAIDPADGRSQRQPVTGSDGFRTWQPKPNLQNRWFRGSEVVRPMGFAGFNKSESLTPELKPASKLVATPAKPAGLNSPNHLRMPDQRSTT
jgi:hypothetical protein